MKPTPGDICEVCKKQEGIRYSIPDAKLCGYMIICDACDQLLRRSIPKKRAIRAIERERDHQDEKWGTIEEHPHTIPAWILIMERELQEAKEAYFQRPAEHQMLAEIVQVVAVGHACLEQHLPVGFRFRGTDREVLFEELNGKKVIDGCGSEQAVQTDAEKGCPACNGTGWDQKHRGWACPACNA